MISSSPPRAWPLLHMQPPASPRPGEATRPRPWQHLAADADTIDADRWRSSPAASTPAQFSVRDGRTPIAVPLGHALGALLGLAVGDAFGVGRDGAVVDAPPYPARLDGPLRFVAGGGPVDRDAGEVTGAVQMAAALAASVVAAAPLRLDHLAARYLAWARIADHLSPTLAASLRLVERGCPAARAGRAAWEHHGRPAPTASALVRTTVLGVLLAGSPEVRRSLAMADASLGDFDPAAQLRCAGLGGAIAHALTPGATPRTMLDAVRDELVAATLLWAEHHPDLVAEVCVAATALAADLAAASEDNPFADLDGVDAGASEDRVAFRHALWHAVHGTPVDAAIIDVANRGGSAAASAAVTGALLGALQGVSALPRHWIEAVLRGPGLAAHDLEFHPRALVQALTLAYGGPADPALAASLAPYVSAAFPELGATSDATQRLRRDPTGPWQVPGVDIVARLRGDHGWGQFRARLDDGRRAIVTTATAYPEANADIVARLGLDVPGVAPLVDVWRYRCGDETHRAMVELEPAGAPLATPTFAYGSRDALTVFAGILAVVDAAVDRGTPLLGLRPESIYAARGGGGLVVTGVLPRCDRLGHRPDGETAAAYPFAMLYGPPETYRTGAATSAGDVHAACAVLLFLLERRAPFGASGIAYADQIATMKKGPPPVPLTELPAIRDAVRAGLDPDPARRPTARDLLQVLAAAGLAAPVATFVPAPVVAAASPALHLVPPPDAVGSGVTVTPIAESFTRAELLSDSRWRGVDRGGRRVLITEAPPLLHDAAAVQHMLRMDVAGIAALRYFGRGLQMATMCVEDEPSGERLLDHAGRHDVRSAARIGAAVAEVVARCHAGGVVIGGIRLETTYWQPGQGTCELAPRFVPFWRSCRGPSIGRIWPADVACESPEVNVGKTATFASDVYSVALLTAWLVDVGIAGRVPLEGPLHQQWMHVAMGHPPHVAPALAAALAAALGPAQETRPSIIALRDALLAAAA